MAPIAYVPVTLHSVFENHRLSVINLNLSPLDRVIHAVALIIFPIFLLEFAIGYFIQNCFPRVDQHRRYRNPVVMDHIPGPNEERNLPPPTSDEIAAALAAVTRDPTIFHGLRYSIKHNRSVALAACGQEPLLVRNLGVGAALLADRDFIKQIALGSGSLQVMPYADPSIRNDQQFWVDLFIENNPEILVRNFEYNCQDARELWMQTVPWIRYLPGFVRVIRDNPRVPSFFKQWQFIIDIVTQNGLAIQYLPPVYLTDELAGLAVMQNPAAKNYIPSWFIKGDVLELIKTRPALLPFVSEGQRTTDMCLKAIEVNPSFLKAVPASIQNQDPMRCFSRLQMTDCQQPFDELKSVIFSALAKDPRAFKFIVPEFLTQYMLDFVIQRHQEHRRDDLKKALECLAQAVRDQILTQVDWVCSLAPLFNDDREFMRSAILRFGIMLNEASETLRDDEPFVREVIAIYPEQIDYASDRVQALIPG